MTTIHEEIRVHLLGCESIIGGGKADSLRQLRLSEWSPEFEQFMRNRLITGSFRYGKMNRTENRDYDNIGSINDRLDQYRKTNNKECLVDIANLAMLEFMHNPDGYFEAIDDGKHVKKKKK